MKSYPRPYPISKTNLQNDFWEFIIELKLYMTWAKIHSVTLKMWTNWNNVNNHKKGEATNTKWGDKLKMRKSFKNVKKNKT